MCAKRAGFWLRFGNNLVRSVGHYTQPKPDHCSTGTCLGFLGTIDVVFHNSWVRHNEQRLSVSDSKHHDSLDFVRRATFAFCPRETPIANDQLLQVLTKAASFLGLCPTENTYQRPPKVCCRYFLFPGGGGWCEPWNLSTGVHAPATPG